MPSSGIRKVGASANTSEHLTCIVVFMRKTCGRITATRQMPNTVHQRTRSAQHAADPSVIVDYWRAWTGKHIGAGAGLPPLSVGTITAPLHVYEVLPSYLWRTIMRGIVRRNGL